MKKILLLISAFCFFAFPILNAQTNKGRIMVGASSTVSLGSKGSDLMGLGFSSTTHVGSSGIESDPYKTRCLNLIPKVGYFFIDNLAVGLDITVSTSTETQNNNKTINALLCFGPYARYYLPMDKFLPFVELNSSFGFGKEKYKYAVSTYDSEYKSNLMLFGGWVGMAMPLGDRVTFDIMAGYNYVTHTRNEPIDSGGTTAKTKDKVGTVGLKMGFVIFFVPK